jgi:hypothetical protein
MTSPKRRTNVLKVRRAILARVLDHHSAAARVIIQVLGHIINSPVNKQPAVLGGGMLCQLFRSNFSDAVDRGGSFLLAIGDHWPAGGSCSQCAMQAAANKADAFKVVQWPVERACGCSLQHVRADDLPCNDVQGLLRQAQGRGHAAHASSAANS